jgi:hypothetical protein
MNIACCAPWQQVTDLLNRVDLSTGALRAGCLALAAGVAWKTQSVLFTLAAGMAALWAFGALAG